MQPFRKSHIINLRLSMISRDHKHSTDSEALWAQVRAPEFMPEDPEAFLALLESRFHEARMTG
ncbi:unnamed protein product [Echinostoma caproni]|uniref:Uncharacterized protein n=1 Tax=Echinostoma caproni TaxID=27848 RepID=A0A3P8CDN9_9TREM|nr:unnamed protein product [Echinostoma caproni]